MQIGMIGLGRMGANMVRRLLRAGPSVRCIRHVPKSHAVAWDLVQTFLAAEFSQAQRHLRGLGKVASLETEKE